MIALEIENKTIQKQVIFSNLKITLPSKGLFILKGANGSGKTTLLNILSGLDLRYKGKLLFEGSSINRKNNDQYYHDVVKIVFQNPLFFPDQTVLENLRITGRDDQEIEMILKSLDLELTVSMPIKDLSTGEKARIALIRAFLYQPRVILLDETTANLDYKNATIYIEKLKKISEDTLIIFSTHENLSNLGLDKCPQIDLDSEQKEFDYCSKATYKPKAESVKSTQKTVGNQLQKLTRQNISFLSVFIFIFVCGAFLFGFSYENTSKMNNTANFERAKINFFLKNYEVMPLSKSEAAFKKEDIYYYDVFDTDEFEENINLTLAMSLTELSSKFSLTKGVYPQKDDDLLVSDEAYEHYFSNRSLPIELDSGQSITGVFQTAFDSGIYPMQGLWRHAYDFSHEMVIKKYVEGDFYGNKLIKITPDNREALQSTLLNDPMIDNIANAEGNSFIEIYSENYELFTALYTVGIVTMILSLAFVCYLLYRKNVQKLILERLLVTTRKKLMHSLIIFSLIIAALTSLLSLGFSLLGLSVQFKALNEAVGGVTALFKIDWLPFSAPIIEFFVVWAACFGALARSLKSDIKDFAKRENDL